MESFFYTLLLSRFLSQRPRKPTTTNCTLWDTSNISNLSNLFFNCTKLKQIDLHTWNTKSVSTCYWLFRGCSSLEFINIDGWNTCNVYDMDRMFGECSKLITIKGLNKLNTSNVQFMRLMFISDTSLKSLDLSSFDTQNCIDTSQMFRDCYNLKSIYVSDTFVMTKVYNSTQMFLNCISLIGGAGTTFDPSFIDGTAARIDGGVSNPGYFTAIFQKPIETGTVINIEGSDYIIMGQKDTNKFLVTSKKNVRNMGYQHDLRDDGLNKNTYENSSVDKYLENEWYASLSERMKSAIEISIIKQVSYSAFDKNTKQENGPNEQVYNTIKRHVYLPSVEELNMLIDLDNPTKVKDFLGENSILIRDSYQPRTDYMMVLYANTGALDQGATHNDEDYYVRPTFVIDLSKVDYTVTGTVNYK